MSATDLREKLDDLIIELVRLDITLDSPVSDITVGEYEQEREKLLDEFIQAIAATLGGGECEIETTENWLPAERYHRCKHCGAFFAVMNASGDIQPCVCPNCGRKVKR